MAQVFGILGFLLSLLAVFFASEVMRRANHNHAKMDMALFKLTTRIQQIESKMAQVDRLAAEVRYEKKRQAETINAMAQKGQIKPAPTPHERAETDRFTPSSYKQKNAG